MFALTVILVTALKLLLIPSYRSTDFEVHRNWLAITHNLPLNRWYFESRSEWTLDYPPLFAWFEYLLTKFAPSFDAELLNIDHLNYASTKTVLFQRLTVICSDIVYLYGVQRCSSMVCKNVRSRTVFSPLLLANVGLLMVDHIHFQYNGMIFGYLLISIHHVLRKRYLQAAFWFAFVINLKHINLYLAPAYFVFLLRNHCFASEVPVTSAKALVQSFHWRRTVQLGCVVLGVFFVSFVPFYDHLGQVISRLFPFRRGLCHAYWAPNFWAVYNVIDKVLDVAGRGLGLNATAAPVASMTGGLVREFSHTVLPDIKPVTTLCLTGLFLLPALWKLWKSGANSHQFIRCLILCGLTSFLFGWHVHEKAILIAIIPLGYANLEKLIQFPLILWEWFIFQKLNSYLYGIISVVDVEDARIFLLLSVVGNYSIMPLLFPASLTIIKCLLVLLYAIMAFYSLLQLYPFAIINYSLPLLNVAESVYVFGLIPLFIYTDIAHSLLDGSDRYAFLPLLLTSLYCSIGVIYCWLKYYVYFLCKCVDSTKQVKEKSNQRRSKALKSL